MDEAIRNNLTAMASNGGMSWEIWREELPRLAQALLQLDQQMTEMQSNQVHAEYVKFTRTLVNQLHNHRHLLEVKEGEPVWTTAEITRAESRPSEPSSAPTGGPAPKPSESSTGTLYALTANQRATLWQYLREATMACSKLQGFTPPDLDWTYLNSSTLQLTLRWPSNSGSNEAGSLGHAPLNWECGYCSVTNDFASGHCRSCGREPDPDNVPSTSTAPGITTAQDDDGDVPEQQHGQQSAYDSDSNGSGSQRSYLGYPPYVNKEWAPPAVGPEGRFAEEEQG